MILIDTSAWIEFFRKKGKQNVKKRVASLIEHDQATYTCPILFELRAGAREREISDIEVSFSFCNWIPFDAECWKKAVDLERELREKGVTVPRDDIFVASVAILNNIALYSTDAHFQIMIEKGDTNVRIDP